MGVEDPVAVFARAAARLADSFGVRSATLAEMGMTEASWKQLEQSWFAELARRARVGERVLAQCFADAFAAERERLRLLRMASEMLSPHGKPRGVIRALASENVDTTGDAFPALEPALPFRGERAKSPAAAPPVGPAAAPAAAAEDDEDATNLNETLAIDSSQAAAEPLPFGRDNAGSS